MLLLSFNDFILESKSIGKSFYTKMKKLNDQIEGLKEIRKERVKPYNAESDPKKKDEIKKDLVNLTKQINDLEVTLQKMRAEELDFIQNLDANAELELSERALSEKSYMSAIVSPKYTGEFAKNFLTFLPNPTIGKWTLNLSSLNKDEVFVWNKDNLTLYAEPFLDIEESIKFILLKDNEEVDLKELGNSKKVYLKLTQNYLLDVKNYMKEMEKYFKKLNKTI